MPLPSAQTLFFFFSSTRRHTRSLRDWSSDVCSSDLPCSVSSNHFWVAKSKRKVFLKPNSEAARYLPSGDQLGLIFPVEFRSEERRVGKECRCGWLREQ